MVWFGEPDVTTCKAPICMCKHIHACALFWLLWEVLSVLLHRMCTTNACNYGQHAKYKYHGENFTQIGLQKYFGCKFQLIFALLCKQSVRVHYGWGSDRARTALELTVISDFHLNTENYNGPMHSCWYPYTFGSLSWPFQ